MKIVLKQLVVRLLLALLRGLILVKRHGGPILRIMYAPLAAVGRFLLRLFGVPAYRFLFLLRRHGSRMILPAKNRLLYLVSNRHIIHVAMITVAVVAIGFSLGQGEVRAETFGSQSILFSLVSEDDSQSIEIVSAAGSLEVHPSSYMNDPSIDVNAHIDLNYLGEDYVTTTVGGTALATREQDENIPKREGIVMHTVEGGDTLGGIAAKYGLNLSTILWANNLTFRSTIKPGQEITILPIDGVQYTVKNGDSINRIANRLSAEADEIIKFNKLANANDIVVGEELMVPGGEKPTTVASAPARTAPVSSLFSTPTPSTSSPRGSSTGRGTWVWPTDWRVITQYYGWRHTGLDVDGDYSTRSYAASDGVVIFNGWRRGYGLTIEIDHGNGLTTRYAHHSKNYVEVGEVVTAGQIIAQTGTTGRSTGTHLHFEVIKNGRFQNPLDWVR